MSSSSILALGVAEAAATNGLPISRVAVAAPQLVWIMTIVLGMECIAAMPPATHSYLPFMVRWHLHHVGPLLPLIPLGTRAMAFSYPVHRTWGKTFQRRALVLCMPSQR